MSRYLKNSFTLHIDSRNRNYGNDSNFNITVNIPPIPYNKICLLDASIPKSYYVLQDGYNYFYVSENGVERTVTLTAGNYTRSSFATYVKNALNTGGVGYTYTVTYPSGSSVDTGKYTFGVDSANTVFFRFDDNSCYEQMGFDSGSSNYFVAQSLVSSDYINLQSESTLLLCSDSVESNDEILAIIYGTNISQNSFVVFQCPDVQGYSKKLRQTSTSMNFQITDEKKRPINLNGLNCVFTVLLYQSIYTDIYIENLSKGISAFLLEYEKKSLQEENKKN